MARRITQLTLLGLILMLFTVDSPGATIALRGEASVASPVVRVGDVTQVSGPESAEELEAIRSVAICSAPSPAEKQVVTLNSILYALAAAHIDITRLELKGPAHVLITREHALLFVDELRDAFSRHVSQKTGWPADSFVVRPPKNFEDVPVPKGKQAIIVETHPNENFHGSVLAEFGIVVNGAPYTSLMHRFTIERYTEALVSISKIPRGQVVKPEDVELKKVEQTQIGEDSVTDKNEAVGLLATRTIYPGRILSAEFLTPPPIIRRGQETAVVWEGNGFTVMTRGRALEDGCANELVRVRLPSRKIVKAKVMDAKTLQIARQGENDEELD